MMPAGTQFPPLSTAATHIPATKSRIRMHTRPPLCWFASPSAVRGSAPLSVRLALATLRIRHLPTLPRSCTNLGACLHPPVARPSAFLRQPDRETRATPVHATPFAGTRRVWSGHTRTACPVSHGGVPASLTHRAGRCRASQLASGSPGPPPQKSLGLAHRRSLPRARRRPPGPHPSPRAPCLGPCCVVRCAACRTRAPHAAGRRMAGHLTPSCDAGL